MEDITVNVQSSELVIKIRVVNPSMSNNIPVSHNAPDDIMTYPYYGEVWPS